jgi:hypothetical protein
MNPHLCIHPHCPSDCEGCQNAVPWPMVWIVESGAVGLPLGHPSRLTTFEAHDTEVEARAALAASEFNGRVFSVPVPTDGVDASGPLHSCKNCAHLNKSSCEEPCAGCTVRWRSGVSDRWELASGVGEGRGETLQQNTPMKDNKE